MAFSEPMFLVPIRFTTANPVIRVTRNTTQDLTLSVNTDEDYWMSGDGNTTTGQRDLCERLQTCLRTHGGAGASTFTVTISAYNIITITCVNAFSILWSHANTTADETLFGFTAQDTTSFTTVTAPNQTKGVWMPSSTTRAVTYRRDTRDLPITVGAIAETIDGQSRGYQLASSLKEREVSFVLLDRAKVLSEYASSTELYGAFEYSWANGMGKGSTFRLYDDRTIRSSNSYKKYRVKSLARPFGDMEVNYLNKYELKLPMVYVGTDSLPNTYSLRIPTASDYVDFGDVADLDGITAMSVSFWMKKDAVDAHGMIFSKTGSPATDLFYIDTASDGRLNFFIYKTVGTYLRSSNTGMYNAGAWVHCVVTYDGATGVKWYINGVDQTGSETGTLPTSLPSGTTATLRIGTNDPFLTDCTSTNLDEMAVLVGTALSATQPLQLYNIGHPGDVRVVGNPRWWWRMENNYTDTMGNLNGSAGGSPTFQAVVP